MCNPALAIGVASTLGGTYLKNQAANRADRLAASAEDRFNQSNVALEGEARDAVNKTGSNFERSAFDAGTGMETERLRNLFDTATTIPQRTLPIASGVPAVIGETMNAEAARAAAFNQQQANALAELQGFGDFLANRINPQMANSANTVGMMGNMMQGNANVLNADLRAAKRAADSPMGDLLQMAGNVGTSYGLYTG